MPAPSLIHELIGAVDDVTRSAPVGTDIPQSPLSSAELDEIEKAIGTGEMLQMQIRSRFRRHLSTSRCVYHGGREVVAEIKRDGRSLYLYSESSCKDPPWNVIQNDIIYHDSNDLIESKFRRLMENLEGPAPPP